ncbi:MAG TPA: trypsin-like peptidase domain-containing protein [Gemmatimonadaceae bacterium]|nr:trypsin-like peptidase domain-containing protein [Gemmatimonadaceae bacterium]
MSASIARWVRAVVLTFGVALTGSIRLVAQETPAPTSKETEQIVVMIRCTIDGEESIGAGILFGSANDRLYVVTANHVVRRGATSATDIRVELRSLPGEPVPATLTTRFDAPLDVAVLSIAGVSAKGISAARLPFDRLGDPTKLSRGDGVYVLGQPQGRPWGTNVAPIPVASVSDSVLVFETSQVVPGHSGGALLDARGEIVGLVLNVQPPDARARNVVQVAELLRGWGFPVALRGRFALAEPELVSAGTGFTCALRRDGAAFCWGSNDHGELGSGTRGASTAPIAVSTPLRFASVSAGSTFTCALTTDGVPYCWGNAALDDGGPGPVRGDPIERRVAARVDGELTFASLSAGGAHACGVTTAGVAYCWGDNEQGQLGDRTTTPSETPVRVAADARFRVVSAGFHHSCALTTDGRAYCWGAKGDGEVLGTGAGTKHERPVQVGGALRFASLSAGIYYTCAVTTAAAGYCWGNNEHGQLGDGTTKSAATPRAVAGGHRFRYIAAQRASGRAVTCGLTTDAKALCWGWESEALGRHDTRDSYSPAPVVGSLTFRSLSVGFSHTCGVTTNGAVYCWGDNRYGQLGDGATATHLTPGLVPIPP